MTNKLFIVLMATSISTNAAVFKCKSVSGALEYTSEPCVSTNTQQNILPIKVKDPYQEEQARIHLNAWENKQAADKKRDLAMEKAQQEEQDKQIKLNMLARSTVATEQQILATQNLAGQIERQNRLNAYNTLYEPSHDYNQQSQNTISNKGTLDREDSHRQRHGHEGRHLRRHNEQLQHQQQLGDYGVYRPEGSLGNAIGE